MQKTRHQDSLLDAKQAAATIRAAQADEWIPAADLLAQGIAAEKNSAALEVDLAGPGYLDASVLQVLLALVRQQGQRGLSVRLLNASPALQQWFAYAGAASYLVAGPKGSGHA